MSMSDEARRKVLRKRMMKTFSERTIRRWGLDNPLMQTHARATMKSAARKNLASRRAA